MQALDFVNESKPMDLGLLMQVTVADNLLVLAAKDQNIAENLIASLASAVAEKVGGTNDRERVDEHMSNASKEIRLQIALACELTMAVGYAYGEILPLLSTYGFSCMYNLEGTHLGRIVLMGLQAGLPPEGFHNFLLAQEIQSDTEGIDWDSAEF